jgi:hypothetical protein
VKATKILSCNLTQFKEGAPPTVILSSGVAADPLSLLGASTSGSIAYHINSDGYITIVPGDTLSDITININVETETFRIVSITITASKELYEKVWTALPSCPIVKILNVPVTFKAIDGGE